MVLEAVVLVITAVAQVVGRQTPIWAVVFGSGFTLAGVWLCQRLGRRLRDKGEERRPLRGRWVPLASCSMAQRAGV